MSIELVLFLIGLGTIPGYFAGRTRAEWGRARMEAKRAITGRKGYRD